MDATHQDELQGRLLSLLILVQDRLGEHARNVRAVIDAGDYGLSPARKRDGILTLGRTMQMDDLTLGKLRSCPRPG